MAKLMARTNLFVPTLYPGLDIMLGQNVRDQKTGELLATERGFRLGWQYVLGAKPGIGKTSFSIELASVAIKLGYPIKKVIIVDSDSSSPSPERISKLTKLPKEIVDEYFEVWDMNVVEDITDKFVRLSNEYSKDKENQQYVEFDDPYSGDRVKMRPFYFIIMDTVTSMIAKRNSVESVKDKDSENVVANEGNMTAFLKLSGFVNDCTNFFDRNAIWLWNVHLKKNQKEIGKYQAEKEFKSSNSEVKLHMPERLRQKASAIIIYNSIQDSQNLDSPTHPINAYGLEDVKSKSVYATTLILNKSRTGNEGRTQVRLLYIDGSFDNEMHLLSTALDLGILEKGSGMYPNAQTPHIFKADPDAVYENEVMGRRSKTTLVVRGYSRPTNIIEARLLMKYTGDNPEVCKARDEFIMALYQRLEDVLWYELEINSISAKEMETAKKKTEHLFSLLRNINRRQVLTADEITSKAETEMPDTVYGIDNSVMNEVSLPN